MSCCVTLIFVALSLFTHCLCLVYEYKLFRLTNLDEVYFPNSGHVVSYALARSRVDCAKICGNNSSTCLSILHNRITGQCIALDAIYLYPNGIELISGWRYYSKGHDEAPHCDDYKLNGLITSGLYNVRPLADNHTGYDVYCDMTTDNETWIVIQRREDGSIDFFRDWQSYKNGFGDPNHEFWIGNDILHNLTSHGYDRLRIDLWSWEDEYKYFEYTKFTVGSEASNYVLDFVDYLGEPTLDALAYHKGKPFATLDHDPEGRLCPTKFHGAWWYNGCYHSNLNGQYNPSSTTPGYALGICWKQWKGFGYSMKKTEMKLRRSTA